jgi:hypothetical protein
MLDRALRVLLVVLNLCLAITAIIGGLWVIPALPLEWLAGTPFSSYLIPALALALVVGGGGLTAAIGLLFGRSWAPLVSMVTGAAIATYEAVESVTLSLHFWLHTVGLESGPFSTALPVDLDKAIPIPMLLQPIFFLYGVILVGLSAWLRRVAIEVSRPPAFHTPTSVWSNSSSNAFTPPAAGTRAD